MMGSLVYAGGIGLNEAYAAADKDGVAVGDELRRIGYLGSTKPGALRPHAFLELHIEQGPILDEVKVRIGVVESVQGISWIEYTVTGVSNHAGTTPMRLRRDAGYLAASVNLFARKLAWEMGGHQVATVGALSLRPNLINVVPNRAVFTVDLRNTDEAKLKEAEARVANHIAEVAAAERVEVEAKVLARFEPVIFDAGLVDRVEHHARALSLSTRRMPSGAGHDAQMMQRLCPTAMIFVPSVAGLSHNVKEHTETADLVAGAEVLLNLVLELAEA
jgi:N-carbamoyl-L-amino-acid hydrolase